MEKKRQTTSAEEIARRAWVFPTEIYDGCWGGRGAVRRLPDIMESFGGETFRAVGEKRLVDKRRRDAARFLEAAAQSMLDGLPELPRQP